MYRAVYILKELDVCDFDNVLAVYTCGMMAMGFRQAQFFYNLIKHEHGSPWGVSRGGLARGGVSRGGG